MKTLFADQTFYCFSSSVPELEPDRSYTPFGLFAALEHGGDFSAATVALAADGYGQQFAPGVDISGIVNGLGKDCGTHTAGSAVTVLPDETIPPKTMSSPGEFPSHLYDVPGFIGEVAAYANSTAFRRQPQLALWGAICLQSVLAARKIRDIYGGRTDLYVIAMAKSGKGKDHARRVNRRILEAAGLLHLDGPEDIASDFGLLRVLKDQPALLMHMDEIGRILTAIRGAGKQRGWLYSIATAEDQARLVYDAFLSMVEFSPSKRIRDAAKIRTKRCSFPGEKYRDSIVRPLGSESKNKDGLNPHLVIVDELHAWRDCRSAGSQSEDRAAVPENCRSRLLMVRAARKCARPPRSSWPVPSTISPCGRTRHSTAESPPETF